MATTPSIPLPQNRKVWSDEDWERLEEVRELEEAREQTLPRPIREWPYVATYLALAAIAAYGLSFVDAAATVYAAARIAGFHP